MIENSKLKHNWYRNVIMVMILCNLKVKTIHESDQNTPHDSRKLVSRYNTIRRHTMKAVENHCISSLLVNDGYINIYKDK